MTFINRIALSGLLAASALLAGCSQGGTWTDYIYKEQHFAAAFTALGDVPADILMNIAVLATGGFLCAEVGKRTPLLRNLGFGAILATFV